MVFRHLSTLAAGAVRSRFLTVLAATTALSLPMIAVAGPVTVSSSTTAPLKTSTGDGQGPGNITLENNGSITTSSTPPVTVDSSNDVTINGTLRNDAATNATGLFITTNDAAGVGQAITSTITVGGLINLPGPESSVTTASNNVGIRFSGNGQVNGNFVSNSGSQITIGGREAVGISVDTILNGSFTSTTAITANGGGSFGIKATKNITGNFAVNGSIQASGQDSVGVVTGNIGGTYTITSSIATGQQAFFDSNNRRVDAVFGGSAAWIAGNVGGGVLLQGNAVATANENSTTVPSTAPGDSVLATEGSAFGTLRIGPNNFTTGDMVIGVREGTESVTLRGRIQTSTTTLGRGVTAMAVSGGTGANGVAVATILQGGIVNQGGNIDAISSDGTAIGLDISNRATVPYFYNPSGSFVVTASDSGENVVNGITTGGGNAIGITVSADSTFKSLINTGTYTVSARGRTFTATGLIDNSGTLTFFSNTGTYTATIRSDSTGKAIAADLSKSVSNIDFRNSGTMAGSVTLGAGNDAFTSYGGTFTGDLNTGAGNDSVGLRNTTFTGIVDLGAGNHEVQIDGSTKFSGGIIRGTGITNLNVNTSTLAINGGSRIEATNAYFSGATTIDIGITGQNAARPLVDVTGQLTIDSGVKLSTRLAGLVTQNATVTVLSAGDLRLGVPIAELGSASSSYIYGFQYRLNPQNSNQLLLDVTRRTAAQLGLGQNLGTVYETSLTALAADNELFSAIAGSANRGEFESIMSQLQPDSSDASLYAALRAQNLAYGVIRNRLGGIPRTTGPSAGTDYSSFWIQQLGSYGKRDADPAAEQPGYKIYTVGIATGFDKQFTSDLKGGMSIAQVWSLPDELNTRDRPTRIASTQLDFYGRHQNGPNFTQAIIGGSYNSYNSRRRIITGAVEREPEGSWKGFNMGGAIDTGTQLRFSDFRLTPYLRGQYVRVKENSYEETGGGAGVNLAYESRTQDSMRAGAGFVAEKRFVVFQDVGIETALRGDFAREFMADPANITARFVQGGASFTQVGQELDKNVFGLGASIGVRDIFTAFSVDYDAEKSGNFLGHTLSATFRFRF